MYGAHLHQPVSVATGPSRPPLYCSESCRKSYEYMRERLLTEIRILREALERAGTYRVRRELNRRLALREWCLVRYGGHTPAPPPAATRSSL